MKNWYKQGWLKDIMSDNLNINDKLTINRKKKTVWSWFKGWVIDLKVNIRKKGFWFKFTKKW